MKSQRLFLLFTKHFAVGGKVFKPFWIHVNYPRYAWVRRRKGCTSLFAAMNWHERKHFKEPSDFIFFVCWISGVPYHECFAYVMHNEYIDKLCTDFMLEGEQLHWNFGLLWRYRINPHIFTITKFRHIKARFLPLASAELRLNWEQVPLTSKRLISQ